MTDYVVQGTTSTGITLSSGDTMEVQTSGIASNTTILSGGLQTVFKDGITVSTTVSNGGLEIVSSAAQANNTRVSSGGVLSIASEGHALSTTVLNGGLEIVANGATSTFVSSGGSEAIISGGQGFADQVLSGGSVTVSAFSGELSATVFGGGVVTVLATGSATGVTVSSGGLLVLSGSNFNNGFGNFNTISSGGREIISGSGFDSGTTIRAGGSQVVLSGGLASANISGLQIVSAGGRVSAGQVIGNGGEQDVFGTTSSQTIASGGKQVVESGGTASSTTVNSGGQLILSAGGESISAQLISGDSGFINELVSSGGSALNTLVTSGARQFVFAGGATTGTLVSATGFTNNTSAVENLNGGTASNTSVAGTGKLIVSSGGVASNATASNTRFSSGQGGVFVSSGGTAIGTTILSGGLEVVFASGAASGTIVSSGGLEVISAGGAASGTIVSSGGLEIVSSGGSTISTTLSGNSPVSFGTVAAQETVLSGGTATATTVSSGGRLLASAGGITFSAIVSNGGVEVLSSGGVASDTTVLSGGRLVASSGGVASNTNIDSGGSTIVFNGGGASGTTIFAGGSETVSFGGSDVSAVLSGGVQDVFGAASGVLLDASAVQFVEAGGIASGTVIDATDTQVVLSGGTASNTIVSSGGTVELFNSATVNGITLNSGGLVDHLSGTAVITGGTIVDSGTIDAVAPSGSLFIEPDTFTNSGAITVRNGDHVFIQPAASFTNFNLGDLSGGTYDIGSVSILELGFNQFVTTLDATLILGGAGARLQAFDGATEVQIDQTLVTIGAAGTLIVQGDASYNFGNLTDAGTLQIGGNTNINSIAIQGTRTVTLDPTAGFFVDVGSAIGETGGIGSIIVTGDGTVELDGANTYTGGTSVIGVGTTLVISDDINLGTGGTLALGSGTTLEMFFNASPTYTITHTITVAGDPIFQVDTGVTVTIGGLIADGTSAGTVELTGDFSGAGTLVLANTGNNYTGGTVISAGTLEIAASGAAGIGAVTFAPAVDPTLRIDAAAFPADTTFANVISGFAPGDDIDLAGVPFTSGETLSIDTNNLLTVSEGGEFYSLQLAPGDTFAGGVFYLANDGSGDTDIIAISSLAVSAGQTLKAPIVFNGASVTVLSGGTTIDTVINGGLLDIEVGGIVSGGVTFAGTGGTYEIDGTVIPDATVSGFVSGDFFDLRGVAFDSAGGHVDLTSGNVLVVTENGSGYDIHLDSAQSFTGEFFHLASDGSGGTFVTEDTTPCYCPGTLILTPNGEVPVEELQIGDKVVTVSGAARAIEWIGRRSYSGQFVLGRDDILPVCITAGALDESIPRRDLWVSPNHALYLEGVLIEARDLVNGVSVYQAEAVDSVAYLHLELASHDVIFAEGAAAESFIDDDNRGLFHNAAEYWAEHPEPAAGPAQYCAPRCEEGFEVARARARIAERAGLAAATEAAPTGALRGHIDQIGRRITGWAQDEANPEAPVCLDIYAGNEPLGQVVANRYRADLAAAGIGGGRHGFEFAPPEGLAFVPGSVRVCRSRDGAALSPSSALAQHLAGASRRTGHQAAGG